MISDAKCFEFYKTPGSVNDMIRAVWEAGRQAGVKEVIDMVPIAWVNEEGETISARDKAAYMNHDLAWPMQLEYTIPLYKINVDKLEK